MSHDPHRHDDLSLERAEQRSRQQLRLFSESVVHQLDGESELLIEINGVPVARIACMDSALAELAAGWSLLYRYIDSPRDFDRASLADNRASVMVRGGIDIEDRRAQLLGERSVRPVVPTPWPPAGEWAVPHDVLLDILREAWDLFREDRLVEGSVHAALASEQGVEVVAFDITAEHAVAKVLGWSLRAATLPTHQILVVNGLVTRRMVDAAARMGVRIIATPHVPTADAFRTARVCGMSIVGYMRHQTVGLFGHSGLVQFDDLDTSDI